MILKILKYVGIVSGAVGTFFLSNQNMPLTFSYVGMAACFVLREVLKALQEEEKALPRA